MRFKSFQGIDQDLFVFPTQPICWLADASIQDRQPDPASFFRADLAGDGSGLG